jgi:hypothetical protein
VRLPAPVARLGDPRAPPAALHHGALGPLGVVVRRVLHDAVAVGLLRGRGPSPRAPRAGVALWVVPLPACGARRGR